MRVRLCVRVCVRVSYMPIHLDLSQDIRRFIRVLSHFSPRAFSFFRYLLLRYRIVVSRRRHDVTYKLEDQQNSNRIF